jgi:5-methylcytosine-specific restriction endonuclease McrA
MAKRPKITKANGRSVTMWEGASPDAKIPDRVKLRVLRRFNGKCALTGILIADGQQFDCDHIVRLEDGGSHSEDNLQPVLRLPHEIKSAAERKRAAKSDRIAKKSHGMKTEPKRPIESAPFKPASKPARIQKQPLPPRRIYQDVE